MYCVGKSAAFFFGVTGKLLLVDLRIKEVR